ncbi:hypothetical protein Vafri_8773 [Volvox africanus]|uniref:Uncharacterized protein n=1 Tax=Volvox africanus TaxID=51714 RepID=A0A8J4B387_9CHLO|nr:hypothetical protein Vafri_8773 [Volvox africanus]
MSLLLLLPLLLLRLLCRCHFCRRRLLPPPSQLPTVAAPGPPPHALLGCPCPQQRQFHPSPRHASSPRQPAVAVVASERQPQVRSPALSAVVSAVAASLLLPLLLLLR